MARTQIEAKNYKEQLEKQKDYPEIKQERDQLKTKLNQKESQIIGKIINKLKLELNNEASLEKVLDKIKELIVNKTPDTNQETTLNNLRQQIAEKDKEIQELKNEKKENYALQETIKKGAENLFKELNVNGPFYQRELNQISSFQELENFRQEVIKKGISELRKQKNKVNNLNIILWVLLISSLL